VLIKSQLGRSTVKHNLYLLRVVYKSVNNYMFRPLYWPSSGCTLTCYKAKLCLTVLLHNCDVFPKMSLVSMSINSSGGLQNLVTIS